MQRHLVPIAISRPPNHCYNLIGYFPSENGADWVGTIQRFLAEGWMGRMQTPGSTRCFFLEFQEPDAYMVEYRKQVRPTSPELARR